jgi:hypothetical protein
MGDGTPIYNPNAFFPFLINSLTGFFFGCMTKPLFSVETFRPHPGKSGRFVIAVISRSVRTPDGQVKYLNLIRRV